MFERFTDRARRCVVIAQEEARLLKHNYIGTEHLLLGILEANVGGIAQQTLTEFGVETEKVRAKVKEIIGVGQQAISPGAHIPFTPRAKKVLELALREALQIGHNYIGTEHILLGLIREGEGVGMQVLASFGVGDIQEVRKRVIEVINHIERPAEPAPEPKGPNPLLLLRDAEQAMEQVVITMIKRDDGESARRAEKIQTKIRRLRQEWTTAAREATERARESH